ncbi:unnamed protein product [Urochloa humidicola]
MGKLAEEFNKADLQYQRAIGWLPPLMPQYVPDPHPCYSLAQCERVKKRLYYLREWVFNTIQRILEEGGDPFLFPADLASKVTGVLGKPREVPFKTVQPAPGPVWLARPSAQLAPAPPQPAPGLP